MATNFFVIATFLITLAAFTESWSFCGNSMSETKFHNVIYDASGLIRGKQDLQPNYFCNHSFETTEMQLCTQAYYNIGTPAGSLDVPASIRKYFSDILFNRVFIPEISFIFRLNDICSIYSFESNHTTNGSTAYFPDAILVKRLDKNQTCQTYCDDHVWNQYPTTDMPYIGLELNERQLDCALQACPYLLENIAVLVLNVNIAPITTVLSYGSYVKRLSRILQEKVSRVRGINYKTELYFRLSLINTNTLDLFGRDDIYRAYLALYSNTWVNQNVMAKVLLDTFPKSISPEPYFEKDYKNIYPYLPSAENLRHMDFETSCQLPKLRQISGSVYDNLLIEIDVGNRNKIVPKCNESNVPSDKPIHTKLSNLNAKLLSENETLELLEKVSRNESNLNFQMVFVQSRSPDSDPFPNETMTKLWKLTSALNISLGCINQPLVNEPNLELIKPVQNYCDKWFQKNPVTLVEWFFDIKPNDYSGLSFILSNSNVFRKTFLAKYPGGQMFVKMSIFDTISSGETHYRRNLYCSPFQTDVKDLKEAIKTWAQIHNFPIIIEPIVDSKHQSGYWYNVVTEDELNRTLSDFPVLVRRNVQETVEHFFIPNTYPCMHWTEHLLNSNLSGEVEKPIYTGITVNLNFHREASSNIQYMQQLIAISFERFNVVELVGDDQLDKISEVLASNLDDALQPRKHDIKLYIEFSTVEIFRSNLNPISSSAFRPRGIHLTGWENHEKRTQARLVETFNEYGKSFAGSTSLDFGITVQNCVQQINSGLKQINALLYRHHLKYIICILKPVSPTNSDQNVMQIYLDTHFYIKKYFKDRLNLETYFRMSFLPKNENGSRVETENYLRFLNDTNQYTQGYGLTYFMGNAFSTDQDNEWSWWQVSKANLSNITELESKHFGKSWEQKYKVLPLKNFKRNIGLVIGLSVFLVISLVATCALWVYNRRMRQKILTKEEVNAFRNGEEVERNEESIGVQYVQVNTIKTLGFNPDFEISKRNVQLDSVVGRGNFGLVYTAILNEFKQVAVKIPNTDCSKESFKSMLAEVKILCYIGNHPNVLSFIGAYTKEIDRGLIYVVTEFCPNGSLERYLRRKQPRSTRRENSVVVGNDYVGYVTQGVLNIETSGNAEEFNPINELLAFAYEIASGMEYIARKKVVHADLSTRNVLLDSDMTCKIGDFGLSRKLYESMEYIKKGEEALPWKWMAVESLKKMEFTTKSDVWSFGVTLWEIFSLGENPYPGISWDPEFPEKLFDGLRLSKPQYATEDIFSKMLECWNISSESRPSFTDLTNYFETFISF